MRKSRQVCAGTASVLQSEFWEENSKNSRRGKREGNVREEQ